MVVIMLEMMNRRDFPKKNMFTELRASSVWHPATWLGPLGALVAPKCLPEADISYRLYLIVNSIHKYLQVFLVEILTVFQVVY